HFNSRAMIRLQIVMIATLLLNGVEAGSEHVIDNVCRGKVCYQVVDRHDSEDASTVREIRLTDSRSNHLVISQ
ncbi:hypothetical protein PFISCL1PPCAC_27019, partial [Pristionchus fissidentatus]